MPDFTARVTEILREHQFWHADYSSVGPEDHCRCGYRPRDRFLWDAHVAALIAAAAQEHYRPRIEAVECPKCPGAVSCSECQTVVTRSGAMSDPAVGAAQRACSSYDVDHPRRCLEAAAREALKPIRELHQPNGLSCGCCGGCSECDQPWPCDTAKLIYTTEELEQ